MFKHPGKLVSTAYEKDGDKFLCVYKYEVTEVVIDAIKQENVNKKAGALAFDPQVVVDEAEAEIAKIDAMK